MSVARTKAPALDYHAGYGSCATMSHLNAQWAHSVLWPQPRRRFTLKSSWLPISIAAVAEGSKCNICQNILQFIVAVMHSFRGGTTVVTLLWALGGLILERCLSRLCKERSRARTQANMCNAARYAGRLEQKWVDDVSSAVGLKDYVKAGWAMSHARYT